MGVLRLVLAWLVIISHSSPIFGWSGLGGSAVTAFFIISGYYMALILDQKYRATDGLWLFYSNRALRLFPLYFFFLLVYFLLSLIGQHGMPLLDGSVHIAQQAMKYATDGSVASLTAAVPNLLFIGSDVLGLFLFDAETRNFLLWRAGIEQTSKLHAGYLVMPHIWSLGVEVIFYALAPVLAQAKLLRLVVVFIAFVILQQLLKLWIGELVWLHLLSLWNLGYFALGMLAFRLTPFLVSSKRLLIVPLAVIPFIIASGVLAPSWSTWVLFALGVPALFFLTKNSAFDKVLGNLSYPVYLCHFLFAWPASVVFGQLGSLVAMLLSCVLSWVALRLIDTPIEKWRQRRIHGTNINNLPPSQTAVLP